jgi:hypothetical protein
MEPRFKDLKTSGLEGIGGGAKDSAARTVEKLSRPIPLPRR